MSVTIDIVVFDGVDELDAIAPYEVFSNAAIAVEGLRVRLVTLDTSGEVVGASGLRFQVSGQWVPGEADILVVPGGGLGSRAGVGVFGEVQRGKWAQPLHEGA